jgi:hypothetical protein
MEVQCGAHCAFWNTGLGLASAMIGDFCTVATGRCGLGECEARELMERLELVRSW